MRLERRVHGARRVVNPATATPAIPRDHSEDPAKLIVHRLRSARVLHKDSRAMVCITFRYIPANKEKRWPLRMQSTIRATATGMIDRLVSEIWLRNGR
jgi:hypothetical protein